MGYDNKVIKDKATRPDGQRYDKVDFYTVPRWKESDLSGDEYRISANADLYYKGNLVKRMSFLNIDTAIRYLDGAIVYWNENGETTPPVDDSYLCDQEGCANIADIKYKRLQGYTSHGEPENLYDWNLYRVFCNQHKSRGDCALDDSDNNYEQVNFLTEEREALEELRGEKVNGK
jgi:hypothetical protein